MSKRDYPTRFDIYYNDPRSRIPEFTFVSGWSSVDAETHKTQTQWSREGMRVRPDEHPVLWVRAGDKRTFTGLFTVEQCTPKRVATPAQLAALQKAQRAAQRIDDGCHYHNVWHTVTVAYAEKHPFQCPHCEARKQVIQRTKDLLNTEFLILDTETTGLNKPDIMQIGILNNVGDVLLDTLVKPGKEAEPGVIAVHHITMDMVQDAPTFVDIYPRLMELLTGKTLVIYNVDFDWRMINRLCREHGLPQIELKEAICAMEEYAVYIGDWSEYHGDYRWQSLPGGDHSAIGDCRATLDVLRGIAKEAAE